MKQCIRCLVEKPESDFYSSWVGTPKRLKLIARCKICKMIDSRATKSKNKEHYLSYSRDYAKKRKSTTGGYLAIINNHMRSRYGITLEDYGRLFNSQSGKCAICPFEGVDYIAAPYASRKNRLHVDHDHETGAIRGLLCGHCNAAIGLMGDDPIRMRKASDYLEQSCTIPVDIGGVKYQN